MCVSAICVHSSARRFVLPLCATNISFLWVRFFNLWMREWFGYGVAQCYCVMLWLQTCLCDVVHLFLYFNNCCSRLRGSGDFRCCSCICCSCLHGGAEAMALRRRWLHWANFFVCTDTNKWNGSVCCSCSNSLKFFIHLLLGCRMEHSLCCWLSIVLPPFLNIGLQFVMLKMLCTPSVPKYMPS